MDSQQSFDDTAIYCPQVKADLIPIKNQEFQTLQDVEMFYKSYAKEAGFNVKSSVSEKKNDVIVRKEYACSKEGTSKFDFLGVNSGGLENIGCLQQDIYNYKRDCRKEVKGHDGDMLYEYFLHEKEKDHSFIFKIEADNENRITHIFWADAIS
ncbi:hypothetical protein ACLB2K_035460 [Fragaria x ananassa]